MKHRIAAALAAAVTVVSPLLTAAPAHATDWSGHGCVSLKEYRQLANGMPRWRASQIIGWPDYDAYSTPMDVYGAGGYEQTIRIQVRDYYRCDWRPWAETPAVELWFRKDNNRLYAKSWRSNYYM